jgi:hypothetical protein
MTWTYSVDDLASSAKDQVRLLVGDTLTTDQQLQDEEILYLLTTRSSVYGAAAECCRSLQAKFSRSVDQSAGGTRTMYSQLAKAYGVKAAEFEQKAATSGGNLPYAGGISIADKTAQEQDSDRVSPQFQIGMQDDFLPVPPAGNESDVSSGGGGNGA